MRAEPILTRSVGGARTRPNCVAKRLPVITASVQQIAALWPLEAADAILADESSESALYRGFGGKFGRVKRQFPGICDARPGAERGARS